jgi:hypothetical protein
MRRCWNIVSSLFSTELGLHILYGFPAAAENVAERA